jgi:protein phosphatase
MSLKGKLNFVGHSDKGMVRPTNQDQFLIAELTKALHVIQSSLSRPGVQYSNERGHLLLVADGVGGQRGGEQASALAVGTIEDFVLNTLKWFFHLQSSEERNVLREFQSALRAADARIFDETSQHPELRGMGTTLTMAYNLGPQLFVVHVGDSRCYLLRGQNLHRLTRDHTLVAEMVEQGALRPEEASAHRLRHVITNAVGGSEPGLRVEAHKVEMEAGDVVLLCSDGLTEMMDDGKIGAVLVSEPDPQRACKSLVDQTNALGGKDNVTVLVARFDAL